VTPERARLGIGGCFSTHHHHHQAPSPTVPGWDWWDFPTPLARGEVEGGGWWRKKRAERTPLAPPNGGSPRRKRAPSRHGPAWPDAHERRTGRGGAKPPESARGTRRGGQEARRGRDKSGRLFPAQSDHFLPLPGGVGPERITKTQIQTQNTKT